MACINSCINTVEFISTVIPFSNFRITEDVRKNKAKYLEQLEQQYQEKKKDLYSLKIIDAPIWKKLREETIKAFEGEYLLNKTLLLAYSDIYSEKEQIL